MSTIKEKDDTRRAILAAAKTEFADKGFSGARMSTIAKTANANQALIHYYFCSKENLYKEVLDSLFGPENQTVDTSITPQWNLTTPQKLYVLIYFVIQLNTHAVDHEGHRIFIWEIAEGRKFLRPFIEKFMVPRISYSIKLIEKGIEEGYFSTASPFLSVTNLMMTINGYQNSKTLFKDTPFEKYYTNTDYENIFASHCMELIFKSLAPDGKPAVIPSIPAELKFFIEDLVRRIAQNKDSEFSCDIANQFFSLIQP